MSDYEEDFIDIQYFSKPLSAESFVGAYRASADRWTASSGITVKIPSPF